MAQLKAFLKTLDGVAPDAVQFYAEEDGVFILDTEKYFAGMSSARDKEKEEARKAKEQLNKFSGLDPEAAKLALAKLHELEEKKQIAEGDIDKVVANRVEKLKTDLESRLANETARANSFESQLSTIVVDKSVQTAAVMANVIPEAMDDILERARKVFKANNGVPVPMKGDETIYGKDGKTPMTITEWLEELKSKAGHLFRQAEGSKGGRPNGTGTGTLQGLEGLSGTEKLKAARRQGNK